MAQNAFLAMAGVYEEMTKALLSTWEENGFSYSVALHQVTDLLTLSFNPRSIGRMVSLSYNLENQQ